MRRLIAGMKVSADAKSEGPDGMADWVESWSNEYDLISRIDACLLGGGMYPGYEGYWTAVRDEPDKPLWAGRPPTREELEWSRFAEQTPHYVLSRTLKSAKWPKTRFLRSPDEVSALKEGPGKDIYLIGGARTTASLIDAGLVDELRLIVYPLIAGEGKALFGTTQRRHALQLRKVERLSGDRVGLVYGIG